MPIKCAERLLDFRKFPVLLGLEVPLIRIYYIFIEYGKKTIIVFLFSLFIHFLLYIVIPKYVLTNLGLNITSKCTNRIISLFYPISVH